MNFTTKRIKDLQDGDGEFLVVDGSQGVRRKAVKVLADEIAAPIVEIAESATATAESAKATAQGASDLATESSAKAAEAKVAAENATQTANSAAQTASDAKTTAQVAEDVANEAVAGLAEKIGDAPKDGSQYARRNGEWSIVEGGGGTGESDHKVATDATDNAPGYLDDKLEASAPIQKRIENGKVVIFQDPVEASPLSRIDTPPLDVIKDVSSAAGGGGYGNNWTSIEGHLFAVPNYFVPEMGDQFAYICTQSQTAISNHQVAIYELDQANRQIHLVCLSENGAANDATTGRKTLAVKYINPDYNVIKPNRLYYACHICNQSALNVAGISGSTFNLNPNADRAPLGIAKAGFAFLNSANEIDPEAVKDMNLSSFGMCSEKHYITLRHI